MSAETPDPLDPEGIMTRMDEVGAADQPVATEDITAEVRDRRTDAEVIEHFARIDEPTKTGSRTGEEFDREYLSQSTHRLNPGDPILNEWLNGDKPPMTDAEFQLSQTTETLKQLSRKYISEDMLQTVAAAMGKHSAPALIYVGTNGQVTRVDWESLEDNREIEVLMALLRVAAGHHLPYNVSSEEALRPTSRRRGY